MTIQIKTFGTASQILTTRISAAHAQILTLPTLKVQLLPTPPSGKLWIMHYMALWISPFIAAYTNIDPTVGVDIERMSGAGGGSCNVVANNVLTTANMQGNSTYMSQPLTPDGFGFFILNGALGNFTGGDPSNVMRIQITYQQVNVS